MEKLIFAIENNVIQHQDLPSSIVDNPKHYLYLNDIQIDKSDKGNSFKIYVSSQFESNESKPLLVFSTITEFTVYNFNEQTKGTELHNLIDISCFKHLQLLESTIWQRNYRKLLNTSPDTIRFTSYANDTLSSYWRNLTL